MDGDVFVKTLAGLFPIVATPFDREENVDDASLKRLVSRLIANGSDGLVLLANASEGYTLSEEERRQIVGTVIDHVGERVPVVMTFHAYSVKEAARHARFAQASGASAVMCMPPFFGQWRADVAGIKEYFSRLSDSSDLPIILQDHPLAGIELRGDQLAEILDAAPGVRYLKVEIPNAARKIRAIGELIGFERVGVFGGLGGILFPWELDSGATGTMPSSCYPELFSEVWRRHQAGDRQGAAELHSRFLELLDFELHSGGRLVIKEVLHRRGWIDHPTVRSPAGAAWDEDAKQHLDELLQRYWDQSADSLRM